MDYGNRKHVGAGMEFVQKAVRGLPVRLTRYVRDGRHASQHAVFRKLHRGIWETCYGTRQQHVTTGMGSAHQRRRRILRRQMRAVKAENHAWKHAVCQQMESVIWGLGYGNRKHAGAGTEFVQKAAREIQMQLTRSVRDAGHAVQHAVFRRDLKESWQLLYVEKQQHATAGMDCVLPTWSRTQTLETKFVKVEIPVLQHVVFYMSQIDSWGKHYDENLQHARVGTGCVLGAIKRIPMLERKFATVETPVLQLVVSHLMLRECWKFPRTHKPRICKS